MSVTNAPVTTDMYWTVTADDAVEAGRSPQDFAAELKPVLDPFGVAVDLQPTLRGPGGLRGCGDPTMETLIRQAVARVRTAGSATLAELNQDAGFAPKPVAPGLTEPGFREPGLNRPDASAPGRGLGGTTRY